MDKITSFKLNHNTHTVGFFLSSVNKDIFTYDMRFKRPNCGQYLSPSAMHTIEHLFATVIRNSTIRESVIYFGPMGCRTGFYLLLRGIKPQAAEKAALDALQNCLDVRSIPGNKKIECGNYRSHSLRSAKEELAAYIEILRMK